MVEHQVSRKEEELKKKMIMQRILTPGTLWRTAALRTLLVANTVPECLTVFSCCRFRLLPLQPVSQRWLSTSVPSRAAYQPQHQPPPEEPQSRTTPASDVQKREAEADSVEVDPLQDKSIGLYQRFKKTFKQYGKVMIPVHLVTSSVWFGTFYYAAMKWVVLFSHHTSD